MSYPAWARTTENNKRVILDKIKNGEYVVVSVAANVTKNATVNYIIARCIADNKLYMIVVCNKTCGDISVSNPVEYVMR